MDRETGVEVEAAAFDRAACSGEVTQAEEDRRRVLAEFPRAAWPELELERYALRAGGQARAGRPFCWLMEYGTEALGSIRGGSAAKHIIYRHHDGEWRLPGALRKGGPHRAWTVIRRDFVEAFEAVESGQFRQLDDVDTLIYGQALVTKTLATYFPDDFLPIFSADHLRRFIEVLGGESYRSFGGVRTWQANRQLFALVRERSAFSGWHAHEVVRFLYQNYDPRPRDRVVWKIAPGERGRLWEECLAGQYICVGWDEIGDLSQYESDSELKSALDAEWPGSTGGNLRLARQLLAFRDLEHGDLIVANRGKSEVLALGTVSDGYAFNETRSEYRHTVRVSWDETYAQIFPAPENAWQPTFARVPEKLLRRIQEGRSGPLPAVAESPLVHLPSPVQHAMDNLERKGQIILHGPPGTGKTRLALSVALALNNRAAAIEAPAVERAKAVTALLDAASPEGVPSVTMVTFHPEYGYGDFVEGLKPALAADSSGLNLAVHDGVFLQVCQAAAKDPGRTFLLVVDEINRGDLARILGELVTLLELDKRGIPVKLPVSGRLITVPPNVRLIGTMNTADRSVGPVDAAVRRRFGFIDVPPDVDAVDSTVGPLNLATFLTEVNARITAEFGPDHRFGHACLLRHDQPLNTEEEVAAAFYHEIVPLIEDHAAGRADRVLAVLGGLADPETGRVAQMSAPDLTAKLADEFAQADDGFDG